MPCHIFENDVLVEIKSENMHKTPQVKYHFGSWILDVILLT